ncbi:S8 family serine peptidase [Paludibaculum fermentans]|uniref:S8 family serine peptidase n=1 Tax=Paludibaculum fermentans TaxID=1473598 RepID=A0A7S7NMD4_PALFE|nr:S8 family serine peptidase [Paludibaculum fermentans]QOY85784.1 S8 family serine peptidase [Paludibaculum fermentans]
MRFLFVLLFAGSVFAQDVVPGRFLVELTGAPAMKAQDMGSRRSAIETEQATVEGALQARRAMVVARVTTVANVLVVQAASAQQLAGLPGVKRVEPVERFDLFLMNALPIHQVPQAWAATGGMANAGKGIKIAILDTGIDMTHPGFAAGDMTAPDGFPQASSSQNLALTNGKVIVARSFDGAPVTDFEGHGTAVAMTAAGVQHESPRGTISGVAPAAWIGAYRVADIADGGIYSDTVLRALDWVVQDGMDVVNMSFGSLGRFGASHTIYGDAVRGLADRGIIVVRAAGNTSGPMTVDDTAAIDRVIAVGANSATASTTTQVVPSAGPSMDGVASTNVTEHAPVSGPLVDIAVFDPTGLACDGSLFPLESLKGAIALMERGECDFETKLANVAAAGAVGAVVFNTADPSYDKSGEELVIMIVDNPDQIPGIFVPRSKGLQLKDLAATVEDLQVQLRFPFGKGAPRSLASFSSRGPSVELLIKPDLVATGAPVYTAALKEPYDADYCPVCDPSGYISTQGTSFSSPLVAGAAAVLKSGRPGLSMDEYRSLLIDSASPLVFLDGTTAPVNSAGAGYLNLNSAVTSTIAAAPVSLSFGSGGGTIDLTKDVTVKNVGAATATFGLSVETRDTVQPLLSASEVTVEPGSTATFQVSLASGGADPGAYQGFVKITDTQSGAVARVPYWYAVEGSGAASITILDISSSAPKKNSVVGIYVRVHDQAGLAMGKTEPVVVPVSGGVTVLKVESTMSLFPNGWLVQLRMGPEAGANVFRIEVGDLKRTYSITTP